jgi:hypothetical protein
MEKKFTQDDIDNTMTMSYIAGFVKGQQAERERVRQEIELLDIVVMYTTDIYTILDKSISPLE